MSTTDLDRRETMSAMTLRRSDPHDTVLVWDLALRLWHWSLALCVLVASVTPPHYDLLHRIAGYAVLVLLAFRVLWGIIGPRHARFRTLAGLIRAMPHYLRNLAQGRPGRYLGLNPAGAVMLVALLALLAVSAITGALSVTVTFFGVWWIEDTHAVVSWAVVAVVVLHVAAVIAMSILQRENLPRAMVTGRKRRRVD